MQTAGSEQKSEEPTLRRQVYETIVALSDPVSSDVLQSKLHMLDVQSWLEVVEERYLGRLCGFPTCSKAIRVEFKQKYVINRQSKKIYESSAEEAKFCSNDCFSRHQHVLGQVADQPLWLTGERPPMIFSTDPLPKAAMKALKEKNDSEKEPELITASLISRLTSLKIADSQEETASSSEDENENEEESATTLKQDKREEMKIDRSTSKESKSASLSSHPKNVFTPPPRATKKLSESSDGKPETEEEKLARLRAKYPTSKKHKAMVATPLVEPGAVGGGIPPMNSKTIGPSDYSHFERILNEWLSPSSAQFLQNGQVEDDDNYDGKIDLDSIADSVQERRELTEVEQAVQNFYRGDRVAIKTPEDKPSQDFSREIILPPVDLYDVMVRRREIVMERLHTGWQQLFRSLKLESNTMTGALRKLVRTFHLTADNLDLSPVEWKLASAVLFRLLNVKDDQLQTAVFPEGTPSETFVKFLRSLNCDQQSFADICSRALEKIK